MFRTPHCRSADKLLSIQSLKGDSTEAAALESEPIDNILKLAWLRMRHPMGIKSRAH